MAESPSEGPKHAGERGFFRHLIESYPDLSFLLSEEGKLLFWSPALETTTGLGPEKLAGLPLPEIFSDEDRAQVAKHIASALREDKAIFDVKLTTRGGAHLVYRLSLLHLPVGERPHLVGLGIDQTDCSRCKADLEETRTLFETVGQTVNAIIVGLDAKGRINLLNPAVERITGYTRAELEGRDWFEVLVPRERYPAVWEEFKRLRAGGLPKEFKNPILTKSGEERQILWQNSEVRHGGQIVGSVSVGMDVTDKLRAESQARAYKMFLEVVQRAPVAIALLNPDLSGRYLNPKFSQLFGYTSDDVSGTEAWLNAAFPDPAYREAVRAEWLARVEESSVKGFSSPLEARIRCKEGFLREVEAHVTRVDHGMLMIVLDVTERKRAESALRDLNETLEKRVEEEVRKNLEQERMLVHQSRQATMGEMIGNIAHQWRQPLQGLNVLLANLKDAYTYDELTAEEMGKYIAKGQKLTQKMSDTIDDFRNFFRPTKEKVRFSLMQSLEETLALVDASLKNNNIEVVVDCEAEVMAHGFPNEYSQVLVNLLNNAKDAISARSIPKGEIRVRIAREGGSAVMTIRDNGGGIPEDVLPRVFEAYFTTKDEGTGIGLYMSKLIVENNMAGQLLARNVAGGAEFTVVCPLAPEPGSDAAAAD